MQIIQLICKNEDFHRILQNDAEITVFAAETRRIKSAVNVKRVADTARLGKMDISVYRPQE